MTPEEIAIRAIKIQVEELGAHPLLTDVVVLLGKAQDKLADWVDLEEAAQQRVQATGKAPAPNTSPLGDLQQYL